jgi:hypothetical protein
MLPIRKQKSTSPAKASKEKKKLIRSFNVYTGGFAAATVLNTSLSFLFREPPQPKRTSSMTGRQYIQELLEGGHDIRFQEVLRMRIMPFRRLTTIMRREGLLYDSKHISVEEQLAMFLHVVGRGTSFRDVEERYQHSGETVFRYFYSVLKALTALIPRYIKLPSIEIPNINRGGFARVVGSRIHTL